MEPSNHTSRLPPWPPTEEDLKAFEEANKTKYCIRTKHNNECWVCERRCETFGHAVAPDTSKTRLWMKLGLVDYDDPYSSMNQIQLCVPCSKKYYDQANPLLAFIPEDLEYFIAHEIEDRKRRSAEISRGERSIIYRITPGPAGVGERYRAIFLGDGLGEYGKDFPTAPRLWYGSPSAALRRAFVFMGMKRLTAAAVGDETYKRLEYLRDLYLLKDEEEWSLQPSMDGDVAIYRQELLECTLEDYKPNSPSSAVTVVHRPISGIET
ncbi:hypothetical protein BDW74DRAFT_53015 [Aspergillus multicolor]|uniref:uncharacterized protein n=1 Tax=Aspergillus multicolor TaxID=41759 RepID=UPI003CCDDA53